MTAAQMQQPSVVQNTFGNHLLSVLAGGISGVIAGLLYFILLNNMGMSPLLSPNPTTLDLPLHLLVSGLGGVVFYLTFGQLVTSPGAGMVWGVSFGLLLWLIGPVTLFPIVRGMSVSLSSSAATVLFPLLIGRVVSYGAVLGVLFPIIARIVRWDLPSFGTLTSQVVRATIAGSLAGLLGGLFFGRWTGQIDVFRCLPGLSARSLRRRATCCTCLSLFCSVRLMGCCSAASLNIWVRA